ncbi:MAG TPA: chemotaxis protein CheD [Gaiellaceae bacterium]|jgi:chemotaxis protein CheD|nr:chemotaxis protein CheD [Gaiellaceae bacterium]
MGELAASRSAGDTLVAIGLGSCIGLALVDRARCVAGLAHVMLPESSGAPDASARCKFADIAVPALIDKVVGLGAAPSKLEAVLVGGARMFAFGGSSLDIGARNEEATLAQLADRRIKVVASATAGTKGRTVRVHVDGCRVVSKEAGGVEELLFGEAA